MLKRIRIVNFASCKDVVLDNLGPMTVLVGRNGTGKTNILKAIDWAARSATASLPIRRPPSRWIATTSVEMDIELENKSFKYSFSFTQNLFRHLNDDMPFFIEEKLSVNQGDISHVSIRRAKDQVSIGEEHLKLRPDLPCLEALRSLLPPGHHELVHVNPLFDFLSRVRYDSFDEPNESICNRVIPVKDYEQWKEEGHERSNRTIMFQLLHGYLTNQEGFEELRDILGAKGLQLISNIEIKKLEVDKTNCLYMIELHLESIKDRYFGHVELSLGTRRVIRILASVLFDKNSLTLGEQIEDGIHPGLARKVLGLLRGYSDPAQFILTTHSATVLNTFKPEEIRMVTMKDGETSVTPLAAREVKAAKRYIKEEGTLAEAIGLIEED